MLIFQEELFLLALVLAFVGGARHAWRTTPRPQVMLYEEQSFAGLRPSYCEKRKRPV